MIVALPTDAVAKTMPAIDALVAKGIRLQFTYHLDGAVLIEGRRRAGDRTLVSARRIERWTLEDCNGGVVFLIGNALRYIDDEIEKG